MGELWDAFETVAHEREVDVDSENAEVVVHVENGLVVACNKDDKANDMAAFDLNTHICYLDF